MIPNTLKGLDFDLGDDVNLLKNSIQEFCNAVGGGNFFPLLMCELASSRQRRWWMRGGVRKLI